MSIIRPSIALVQHYAPELEKRCRPHLKTTNDSWRVDETYIKVKKVWTYLYRAVDAEGNTIEFLLSPTRHGQAAKRFARQSARSLGSSHWYGRGEDDPACCASRSQSQQIGPPRH